MEVKTHEMKISEYIAKRAELGILVKFRDGKMIEFSEDSWETLNPRRKAAFDGSGLIEGEDILVTEYTGKQQVIKIDIADNKEIAPLTAEDPKVDEPIATKDNIDKVIQPVDIDALIKEDPTSKELRELLKEHFAKNKIEYNVRAKTIKLVELYENSK